jgi:N-acetylglucosamine kinase-like BadF-type ATPase
MTRYFLGVDIGNTKSHALICDESGQAVGCGIAGPGNHETYGREGFHRILSEVTADAIAAAGIAKSDLAGAGYGIAGYDWSEDTPLMHEVIDSLGFGVPYSAHNDVVPGLIAGSSNGWGVSVTSGTGVNAYGRDAEGHTGRMTGNGHTFGEVGGGSELAYHIIQLISRAWSMRGQPTMLTDLVIQFVGAKDTEDLLAGIPRGRYHVGSAVAPVVFQAAREGDIVALGAVGWLGAGLGDLACGIIRQLGLGGQAFDVVLSGSIYQGSPLILETMQEVVYPLAPDARFVHLKARPVTGAVMLGMEQVGLDFIPLRETIIESSRAMLDGEK